jgi:hypothetical protein
VQHLHHLSSLLKPLASLHLRKMQHVVLLGTTVNNVTAHPIRRLCRITLSLTAHPGRTASPCPSSMYCRLEPPNPVPWPVVHSLTDRSPILHSLVGLKYNYRWYERLTSPLNLWLRLYCEKCCQKWHRTNLTVESPSPNWHTAGDTQKSVLPS